VARDDVDEHGVDHSGHSHEEHVDYDDMLAYTSATNQKYTLYSVAIRTVIFLPLIFFLGRIIKSDIYATGSGVLLWSFGFLGVYFLSMTALWASER
jgi:hypothetical protein